MAGMSLSTGLISGMDTGSLVTQLMQVEANPQTLLKTKLTAAQADAGAYRAVNTRVAGLRAAAEAVAKATSWTTTKATTSASSVTASSGANALPGSLNFTVTQLASAHSVISDPALEWTDTAAAFGAATLTVTGPKGTGPLTLDKDGNGTATLAEAVAAINGSNQGVTAAAVQVAPGKYRLQITASASGAANQFTLSTDTGLAFAGVTTGKDATLTVGTDAPYTVSSTTNTFTGLMPDSTITVSAVTATPVTVTVAADPDAVSGVISSFVSSVNGLLSAISAYTDADSDTATLKGDSTLRALSTQILEAISYAVGTDGNGAVGGVQLNKDGTVAFDAAALTAKLQSDPDLVRRVFAGTPAGVDSGGVAIPEVIGIGGRLAAITKAASDSTVGTLTLLAKSSDSASEDLRTRISDWDVRLTLRKDILTRQFTAMEVALGKLQSQSSWLSSQIDSLPSWSQSSK